MSSRFFKTFSLIGTFVALPILAFSASVSVNGTCESGTCPVVDTLQPGGSSAASFDFVYTLGNTDRYHVFGNYSTQDSFPSSTGSVFQVTAVYLGNSSGSASQADLLTTDMLQNFNWPGSSNGTYRADTGATIGGPIANSSSFDAQVYYNNQGLGLMGIFTGPGSYYGTSSATLSGLTSPLQLDFRTDFTFGAGSGIGATISTLTPEPSSVALFLVAIAGFGICAFRSRDSLSGCSEIGS